MRVRPRCCALGGGFLLAGAVLAGGALAGPLEALAGPPPEELAGPAREALGRPAAPPAVPAAPRPAAVADTILSRADSTRLRVLERLRRGDGSDDPPARDTLEADTAEAPAERFVPSPGQTTRRPAQVHLPENADSVMQALSRLPGYEVATYQGRSADFEARDRRLTLLGEPDERARFAGRGSRVEADSAIVFDDRTGRVRTRGMSLLTPDEGDPVESRSLIYDLRERRGTAMEARTTYREGANWYLRGDLDSVEEGGTVFGSNTHFTSCDLDPPHSHFYAREFKVMANQVLVARGVRMYVEDVPVFWLPFMAQNLGTGRASGILTPSFSVNDVVRTSSGYDRRISNVGYYWAMSDYSDMTVAMDWFSNNYTALTAGLRYSWRRQFLNGRMNLRQYWQEEGSRQFAVNTDHRWEISERTRANLSGSYVTSSAFVAQHSFDPREITQTIDSRAGFSHRFDFGNLSVAANRRQYLTDDRVDMTLPSVDLTLATQTLFPAPPARAQWYNNLSLSGSTSFGRDTYARAFQPDTAFVISRADQVRTRASMNASAGLGALSLGGRVRYDESVFADVPGGFFPSIPASLPGQIALSAGDGLPPEHDPFLQDAPDVDPTDPLGRHDFSRATVDWNTTLGYRVNLIGSTTLTPNVSLSGEMRRSDSIPQAQNLVSGPARLGMGARLQTDLYGFYPGFGDFERIRHKVTPSVTFSYSPAVEPTPLQQEVFGARVARPRQILTFGFNQTWEARLPEPEERPDAPPTEDPADPDDPPDPDDPLDLLRDPPLPGEDPDPAEPAEELERTPRRTDDDQLRRAPRSRVVTLLALNTSAVTYDIVEADSTGQFLRGFQTTRLTNTVRSDYLRGLDLSFEHDLFDDPPPPGEGQLGARRFAPHLSRVSLGFQVDHRSGIVRGMQRFLGVDATPDRDEPEPAADPDLEIEDEDPTAGAEGFDQSQVIPGQQPRDEQRRATRREGWNARVSYSLRRPRGGETVGAGLRAQMLQWSLSFAPTALWDASWSSSYDLESNRFNDHVVRLTRDLHEWEATFGFRQTATGNWSFQFEVALRANRELRIPYEQRSTDGRRPGAAGGEPF